MAIIAVDVWIWSLSIAAHETARLAALLSEDERARAARFLAATDGAGYIAGRGRMREILANYAALSPQALQFSYGAAGKPVLVGDGVKPHFNLSHSAGWAALAVTARHPVGIDIEAVRSIKEEIAERFFSAGEAQAIYDLPAAEQTAAFFRCWTRKEAFVKAVGDGLSYPLAAFEVSIAAEDFPDVRTIDGADAVELARWRLVSLEPARGLVGAIALRVDASGDRISVGFRT